MSETLILFTRYPEPGRSKTRLIPALGAKGAADLHRRLTEWALAQARILATRRGAELTVRFDGGRANLMTHWLGTDIECLPQGPGDLGARLRRAFHECLSGNSRVVVMSSDCPDLDEHILAEAFDALGEVDLVLGPAEDGGYTCIGLSRPAEGLFTGLKWGGDKVLEDTLALAESSGLSVKLLETLADIDRPEDLARLERHGLMLEMKARP